MKFPNQHKEKTVAKYIIPTSKQPIQKHLLQVCYPTKVDKMDIIEYMIVYTTSYE